MVGATSRARSDGRDRGRAREGGEREGRRGRGALYLNPRATNSLPCSAPPPPPPSNAVGNAWVGMGVGAAGRGRYCGGRGTGDWEEGGGKWMDVWKGVNEPKMEDRRRRRRRMRWGRDRIRNGLNEDKRPVRRAGGERERVLLRGSRMARISILRPHLISHNTKACLLVRVSARRGNSMRDTWKWKTIRTSLGLSFSWITRSHQLPSRQNWTYCVYNYVRARVSRVPVFNIPS